MKSDDKTLIKAPNALADEIQAPDDVPAACLCEAADRLTKLTTWIDVNDKLPEVDTKVLTKWSDDEICTFDYEGVGSLGWDEPVKDMVIVAWMPLSVWGGM